MADKLTKMNECYQCRNRMTIAGDCHTKCAKPDADMTGNPHGIRSGWFMYPINFDPVWKEKMCANFESIESNEDAVSDAVSGVVSESKSQ